MKINEITQRNNNYLIILPGRFQPPHRGHMKAYQYLTKHFGEDVFFATSDKVDFPKSPFTFNEKKGLLQLCGAPQGAIKKTAEPYRPTEITGAYDADNTVMVFGISKKDMSNDPRFSFNPKKDGSPSYFQPFDKGDHKPLSQHGYILTIPTFSFKALGKKFTGARQIRRVWPTLPKDVKDEFIIDIFGKYSKTAQALLEKRCV